MRGSGALGVVGTVVGIGAAEPLLAMLRRPRADRLETAPPGSGVDHEVEGLLGELRHWVIVLVTGSALVAVALVWEAAA